MNIIAIGGGDKTPAIRDGLNHLPSEDSSVLIIPTACSTLASFERKVPATEEFFRELGVNTTILHEYGEQPSLTRIQHEIGSAAMIYTIGGNSPYMLQTMAEHGSDKALRKAIIDGKLHAGTSAGALLPFEALHSCIAKKPAEEEWDYKILRGIGAINAVATAHANQRDQSPQGPRPDTRLEHLVSHFPVNQRLGVAIENGAALVIGDTNRIIRATHDANVHLIKRDGDTVTSHSVEDISELSVLDD